MAEAEDIQFLQDVLPEYNVPVSSTQIPI